MAKKRTRKQKENPNYRFAISWDPEGKTGKNTEHVKGQKNKKNKGLASGSKKSKLAISSEQETYAQIIKRDVFRSLGITGLILGLELMLYLFLN